MAAVGVTVPRISQRRRFALAAIHHRRAARVKRASTRRVQWRGHIALQHNAFTSPGRIGTGHRREQRLRVRVLGRSKQRTRFCGLHNLAQVHHRDAISNVTHHRKIVRNEQVTQTHFIAQVHEKIDDLSLNRDIKSRDSLVANDETWREAQGSRNPIRCLCPPLNSCG